MSLGASSAQFAGWQTNDGGGRTQPSEKIANREEQTTDRQTDRGGAKPWLLVEHCLAAAAAELFVARLLLMLPLLLPPQTNCADISRPVELVLCGAR